MIDASWTEPSNFHVVVESHGQEHLAAAIRLAMASYKAVAYYRHEPGCLYFYWSRGDGTASKQTSELPYPMSVDTIISLVWGWLENANRGESPDIDGSVEPNGFIVTANKDDGWSYEMFRVKAVWTVYHK